MAFAERHISLSQLMKAFIFLFPGSYQINSEGEDQG